MLELCLDEAFGRDSYWKPTTCPAAQDNQLKLKSTDDTHQSMWSVKRECRSHETIKEELGSKIKVQI